jgi:hypothetical protein
VGKGVGEGAHLACMRGVCAQGKLEGELAKMRERLSSLQASEKRAPTHGKACP